MCLEIPLVSEEQFMFYRLNFYRSGQLEWNIFVTINTVSLEFKGIHSQSRQITEYTNRRLEGSVNF
jgi:hypothetical protein